MPHQHTKFKPSKLGDIPESWGVTTLGQVLDGSIRNGYSATETQHKTDWLVLSLDALGFDSFLPEAAKPILWTETIAAELSIYPAQE